MTIEFETYPPKGCKAKPVFGEYPARLYREEPYRIFEVPAEWAEDWIYENCEEMSLDDFVNRYGYDDTWHMYEHAKAERVIVREKVER